MMSDFPAGGCVPPIPAPRVTAQHPNRNLRGPSWAEEWEAASMANPDGLVAAIPDYFTLENIRMLSKKNIMSASHVKVPNGNTVHDKNANFLYRIARTVADIHMGVGKEKDDYIHEIENLLFSKEVIKAMREKRKAMWKASKGKVPFSAEEQAAYHATVLADMKVFLNTLYGEVFQKCIAAEKPF